MPRVVVCASYAQEPSTRFALFRVIHYLCQANYINWQTTRTIRMRNWCRYLRQGIRKPLRAFTNAIGMPYTKQHTGVWPTVSSAVISYRMCSLTCGNSEAIKQSNG